MVGRGCPECSAFLDDTGPCSCGWGKYAAFNAEFDKNMQKLEAKQQILEFLRLFPERGNIKEVILDTEVGHEFMLTDGTYKELSQNQSAELQQILPALLNHLEELIS